MVSGALKKFYETVNSKKTVLCLSTDPDPTIYQSRRERLRFCEKIINETAEYISAVKVNENFIRDFSLEDNRFVTDLARENGLLTIYDCKMGDIENTNKAGLWLVQRMGYDFVTFNPILGNLHEAVKDAREIGVGILALLHPSNPSSRKYYRSFMANKKMLYELILDDVTASEAEGVVLGLHPDLNGEEIKLVRRKLGEERIILFPGVGAQGGDPDKAIKYGGRWILINVGRTIIGSPNPRQTAEEIAKHLNELRSRYSLNS